MPHTVNGIGTWYWGKRNLHARQDVCEFCRRTTELKTYDTTLYFVVLFVPLIPLRQVHVLDQCKSCTRHRTIPLKKWEEVRDKSMNEALEALSQSPNDPARAMEAVRAATAFRLEAPFRQLAASLQQRFAGNAELQALMGDAYSFFGDQPSAEECFRRAYQLAPSEDVGRALALLLLRTHRPQEAEQLLRHIIDSKERPRVELIYLLVTGYQAEGNHREALKVLGEIESAFPDVVNEKRHQRLRRTSEKHLDSGKKVGSIGPATSGKSVKTSMGSGLPRLIPPAIFGALLLIYLLVAAKRGMHREVYLVNGLSQPYQVSIGSQKFTLSPMGTRKVELEEGDLPIRVEGEGLFVPPQTVKLHTSFWSRPFRNPVFAINPDGAGVIVRETAGYSASPSADDRGTLEFMSGLTLYEISGVDYPFQEFPGEIDLPDRKAHVTKTRVGAIRSATPIARMVELMQLRGESDARQYAQHYLQVKPNEEELLRVYSRWVSPQEVMGFVKPRLGVRPVLVEWHRAYQLAMSRIAPEHDLWREYEELLKGSPEDPSLQYLAAQVAPDQKAAQALLMKAASAPSPSAHALAALGARAVAMGDWKEGLDYSTRSLAKLPTNDEAMTAQGQALVGLENWSRLQEIIKAQRVRLPFNTLLAGRTVLFLSLQNRVDDAEAEIRHFLPQMEGSGKDKTQLECYLYGIVRYARGEEDRAAQLFDQAEKNNREPWSGPLSARKIDRAREVIAQEQPKTYLPYLQLYLGAWLAKRQDIQAFALAEAVRLSEDGEKEQRQLSRWLAQDKPQLNEAVNLLLPPPEKRLALAALAIRWPDLRTPLMREAGKYNCDRDYPYLLVKAVTDAPQ